MTGEAEPSVQVAVVIPFYQREPGILARSLRSVLSQTLDRAELLVIIVDDESPANPDLDLAQVPLSDHHRVRLIRQKNQGPAAARNTGIAEAEHFGADYVAFLDSDDEWHLEHLATALRCLADGPSFYFCDNARDDALLQQGRVGFNHTWPDRHETPGLERIHSVPDAYRLPATAAFDVFFTRYVSQTSTVVYALDRHGGARFSTALRGAGEDHLMWLEMVAQSRDVAFCDRTNVICGLGVNLYFSAIDWNVPTTRDRYGYLALLQSLILSRFILTPDQMRTASRRKHQAFSIYAYLLVRNLMKGRLPKLALLAQLALKEPLLMALLPMTAARMVASRPSHRLKIAEQVS